MKNWRGENGAQHHGAGISRNIAYQTGVILWRNGIESSEAVIIIENRK
jgi:hypothetical protein